MTISIWHELIFGIDKFIFITSSRPISLLFICIFILCVYFYSVCDLGIPLSTNTTWVLVYFSSFSNPIMVVNIFLNQKPLSIYLLETDKVSVIINLIQVALLSYCYIYIYIPFNQRYLPSNTMIFHSFIPGTVIWLPLFLNWFIRFLFILYLLCSVPAKSNYV